MKRLLFIVLCLLALSPLFVWANEGAVWRVEISMPDAGAQESPGFWTRIRGLIGVRALPITRPDPGTKIVVQSSAYASSPYQTDNTPCITAAGTRVRQGVVATNFLPLGTILSINGDYYIVEDRMNPRYAGKYLDIWFPSTEAALEFGRRALEIQVVEYGSPGQDLEQLPPQKPNVLKRASLRFMAISSFLASAVPANVNRHDVDCSKQ